MGCGDGIHGWCRVENEVKVKNRTELAGGGMDVGTGLATNRTLSVSIFCAEKTKKR